VVDWDALNQLMDKGDDDVTAAAMGKLIGPGFGIAVAAIGISVVSLVALYPVFQAVVMRWWISGLRFGDVTVTSRLRTGAVYRVYLRFLLYLALFMLLVIIVGAIGLFAVGSLLRPAHDSNLAELAASAITIVLYVVVALSASTIYQVVVTAAMWRLAVQSAELSGVDALDHVRATGAPSSALGEGLADALGVGGI
jgi:uncharacterized membrane protein YjgN (DUF898 family)